MPKHQLLRQARAKSLSVKIPKNEPNTARLSWALANDEFLTVEIPRYALERFYGSSETSHRRSTTYLSRVERVNASSRLCWRSLARTATPGPSGLSSMTHALFAGRRFPHVVRRGLD